MEDGSGIDLYCSHTVYQGKHLLFGRPLLLSPCPSTPDAVLPTNPFLITCPFNLNLLSWTFFEIPPPPLSFSLCFVRFLSCHFCDTQFHVQCLFSTQVSHCPVGLRCSILVLPPVLPPVLPLSCTHFPWYSCSFFWRTALRIYSLPILYYTVLELFLRPILHHASANVSSMYVVYPRHLAGHVKR